MEAWNAVQKNITRRKLRSTEPQLFGRLPAPNTAPGPRMGGMNILVPTAPPASDSERRAWSVPDQLYIDWLRTEFEQLMDRAEYDDSLLNWKPGQKPLRSGLPQIRNV
ncbi:hypothetical protein K3495_g2292 [Podosphaera aphanis]|nr:hypothetical protein K3495_g2292 [Podosphaera aphanis]